MGRLLESNDSTLRFLKTHCRLFHYFPVSVEESDVEFILVNLEFNEAGISPSSPPTCGS